MLGVGRLKWEGNGSEGAVCGEGVVVDISWRQGGCRGFVCRWITQALWKGSGCCGDLAEGTYDLLESSSLMHELHSIVGDSRTVCSESWIILI